MSPSHGCWLNMASSSKQPTPDLSHLKWTDFEHIYEPSDDTFLLLDALEKDRSFIESRSPNMCVEVGYVYSNVLDLIEG